MDWIGLLQIALTSIGITEWAKVPFPKADKKVWWILMPVLCLGMAAVKAYLPPWVLTGSASISLSALCYDNIIKLVKAKIDSLQTKG